jgi:hypothetical protein
VVADVAGDNCEAVLFRGSLARDRRLRRIAFLRDVRGGIRGRRRCDGRRPRHCREEPAALVERNRVRMDDADLLQRHLGGTDDAVADPQDGLAVDRERRLEEEVVRLGHGA